jgi:release factor-specific protein-(glutamine-N5) methyltransferase
MYNFLIRLALVPVIMGISYELLKLFAKYDNFVTKILKAPGLLLQKLTVKQPDDKMVEVAIAAFKTVLEMEENPEIKPVSFNIFTSTVKAKKKLAEILTYEDAKRNYTTDEKADRKIAVEREVELILMAVLKLSKHSELAQVVRISADDLNKAKEIATRRQTGEPLQYAISETNFCGFDFIVDRRALIPRFETEILVEKAVKEIENRELPCEVLDICTGSGAIAISIKKLANVSVVASDISTEALSLAKENAEKNDVEIDFIHSDLFEKITGKFDIITANPPYIKEDDIRGLSEEVKNFEPLLALNGGIDGLDYYKRISKEYKNFLKPGGVMFLEIGIDQKEDIEKLFGENIVEIYEDYNTPKIPRIVKVKGN